MDALAKLKEKLEKREKIFSMPLIMCNFTGLPPVLKNAGLDCLIADMEHGNFIPENMGDFAQICRMIDLPLIMRVQDCEYHCISRCLDMGADGVLIPRTESMEQLETAIESMRMFPYGKKGVGGRGLFRSGENVAEFNQNRLLFIQIESPKGVELLDEMLQKYGDQIAGVIIGPSDMTVSLGNQLGGEPDNLKEAIDKTVAICHNHEKTVGIYMNDTDEAKKYYDRGMNFFWIGAEVTFLSWGMQIAKDCIDSL